MGQPLPGFRAIVPAGGAGTRLWPLSRASSPKFLHDLTGSGRSLLQETVDRLGPLTGTDGVVVVTGAAHVPAVAAQLAGLPAANLLAEPGPRDSMPAIGLAAAVLRQREPDVVVGSFAADHVIPDSRAFTAAVTEAVAAAGAGYLATLGVEPTFAATGFGYIRAGEPLGVAGAPTVCAAVEFVEKPDAETARQWLAGGRHWWNAGMFVARAQVLLDLLAEQHPALHDGLVRIAREWDGPGRDAELAATWPGLLRISIDHAVAEPAAAAGRMAVVPAAFGWDDVGDWASLGDLLPAGEGGPRVLGDAALVLAPGCTGVVVPGSGRTVSVLGLEDVVVVDTPDALLVTTREHAQQVRSLVAGWVERGRVDLA